jgi:hypothetical protein
MAEYIIYCDESEDKGRFYSNFYGGALIRASDREAIELALRAAKDGITGEAKWTKITAKRIGEGGNVCQEFSPCAIIVSVSCALIIDVSTFGSLSFNQCLKMTLLNPIKRDMYECHMFASVGVVASPCIGQHRTAPKDAPFKRRSMPSGLPRRTQRSLAGQQFL